MTRVYLIRHGETDFNRQSRYCGCSNVPLNRTGAEQARRLRDRFENINIDAIYLSDLKRAQQTAEIVFAQQQSRTATTELLRELDFGQWEGLTYREILAKESKLYGRWLENPAIVAPPGGESLSDLNHRVKRFLKKRLEEFNGKVIAIVSHAGPIRVLLYDVLEAPLSLVWRIDVELASVSIIDYYEKGACVRLVNSASHLEGIESD